MEKGPGEFWIALVAAALVAVTGCAARPAPALAFAAPAGPRCEADGPPREVARGVHVPTGLGITTDDGVVVVRYASRPAEMRDARIAVGSRELVETRAADTTLDMARWGEITANGMPVTVRIDMRDDQNDLVVVLAPDARTSFPFSIPVGDHEPIGDARLMLDRSGRGVVSFIAAGERGTSLVVIPLTCR